MGIEQINKYLPFCLHIKVKDRVPSKVLRERLRLDNIISVAMLWACVAKKRQ